MLWIMNFFITLYPRGVPVRSLTIKISQWAREFLCCYRKNILSCGPKASRAFWEFRTPFPHAGSAKNPRHMYALVLHTMAQFVLKIEKLSHIKKMARTYGLRPRLWLQFPVKWKKIISKHTDLLRKPKWQCLLPTYLWQPLRKKSEVRAHAKKPLVWKRYIDDVFSLWNISIKGYKWVH